MAYDAVNGLRNKLEEQVQVDLLGLLAVGVEAVFQLHDVDVPQLLHDLRITLSGKFQVVKAGGINQIIEFQPFFACLTNIGCGLILIYLGKK